MNICLISQSNQIRDFIYLIEKILKKGKGIEQVSERLYKPITKSNYEKKQLKRPSNVFPAKKKPIQNIVIQEQPVEEEILQSIKTIESEEVEQFQQKSIKIIPKTFLQTMAYNLRELGLINKMKRVVQDQIVFLSEQCDLFLKNMLQKKEIILLSLQDLKANDKPQKLKAWSYHRAIKQMEKLDNEIEDFLLPLGKEKPKIKDQSSLQQHIQTLQGILNQFQTYTSLNFFDNENIQQILDFLLLYHDAFLNCEKTKLILLQEGSFCDQLELIRKDASKIIAEIKQNYQEFANQFQQKEEQNQIFNEILNVRLLHMALYYILEKAEYQSQHHKELLFLEDKINKFVIEQLSDNSQRKLWKLRAKQIKTLEMVINFVNSGYPYNRSLLIEIFLVKEIYFLETHLTSFDYLKYLNDNIRQLQDTVILRGKFISSINLQFLELTQLNTFEKLAEKSVSKIKTQKQVKQKSATEKQIDYLKQLAEKNRTTNDFLQQKLKSSSGLLKSESENKRDRLLAQLQQKNIAKKHEEKQYDFLVLKYRQQQNNSVSEIKVVEKKHLDIMGQLIYLVSDARFKLLNQPQINTTKQINALYEQHFYKCGFPKCLSKNFDQNQVFIIRNLQESIQSQTQEFQQQLNAYFEDKNYIQYLEITKNKGLIIDAQRIDFINFSLKLSSNLLNLIQYHQTKYSIQSYLTSDLPIISDDTPASLKEYLINSQKISEQLYDVLQKNSDAQLRCEWTSSLKNKIVCTQSQQDKLFDLIRRINHCYILKFEVIRHIYQEFVVEIFHTRSYQFNPRLLVQNYLEKCLQQQLQKKIRYFPQLAKSIQVNLEDFLVYFETQIMNNLQNYYQLSDPATKNKKEMRPINVQSYLN